MSQNQVKVRQINIETQFGEVLPDLCFPKWSEFLMNINVVSCLAFSMFFSPGPAPASIVMKVMSIE